MTTTHETDELTARDRCDRCGAQAYVRVTLASGFDLFFCAHHARAHRDAIDSAASVLDERERLHQPASV
jgi:hypothetical protein